jgi:hypothetical protein
LSYRPTQGGLCPKRTRTEPIGHPVARGGGRCSDIAGDWMWVWRPVASGSLWPLRVGLSPFRQPTTALLAAERCLERHALVTVPAMERRVTVEFGPSRSKRFTKAVAAARSGPGKCQELEPDRYRGSCVMVDGADVQPSRLVRPRD